MNVYGC